MIAKNIKRIEDLAAGPRRALVQAWVDVPRGERNAEMLTRIAMDIFQIDNEEKAFEKATDILSAPQVKRVVKITIERQGLATSEKLEKWADTAGDFLEETVEKARNSTGWKGKKVGVEAAKSLLSNYTRAATGGPKDKIEFIREQLPAKALELFDKDPEALMAEAGEIIEGEIV